MPNIKARYAASPGRVPILSVWPSFLAYDRIQDTLVDHYLEEDDYDLFLAYYRFPDVFFHFATLFLEKTYHDRIDAYVGASAEPTAEVLSEFNRMMADVAEPLLRDKEIVLAKILDRVRKENAYLLVVSDHGFQMSSKGYTHYGLPVGDPAARRDPHDPGARHQAGRPDRGLRLRHRPDHPLSQGPAGRRRHGRQASARGPHLPEARPDGPLHPDEASGRGAQHGAR